MPSLLHPRSSRSFRPRLESLEDRWMPANVTASVTNGVLLLTANSAASAEGLNLSVGSTPGSVSITPMSTLNTTINNSANPLVVTGVRSVRIVLKGGDDMVSVGGLDLSGSLTVLGGDGANNFSINGSHIGGNLTVVNGNNPTGLDVETVNNGVLVAGRTTFSNGAGKSFVEVYDDVDLTGGLTINGGSSDDMVQLSNVRLGGPLRVNLGAGMNEVTLAKVFLGGSAFFNGGSGNDTIEMNDLTVGGGVTAQLGNGV